MQLFVARFLYFKYFVRGKKENWTRELVPTTEDEEKMFSFCEEFEKENLKYAHDVEIENDGFKLKGIYLDFGFKKACLIVAGRSEACRYSYYFAPPYIKAGYNILVIDNRGHGLSEGKYNSLGFKEYKDLLCWIKLLHEEYHNDEVIGHGICIGSATLLYALTSDECPSYFSGMIADGMYTNFVKSFNNHALEHSPTVHFVSEFLFSLFKHYTHENPYKGPIDYVNKLNKPILWLYSKEDSYSTPDQGEALFNKCPSSKKQLEWFPVGTHSHIRVNNTKQYDETIEKFLYNKI